tara:strand:+ start:1618 stop:3789 length:2172 start_codon:yes stop_codon:yes gene_type:complete
VLNIQTMKRKLLTLILLLSATMLMPTQASASHLLGGEIVWRCQGNGKYVFTMTLYRDCGGINLSYASQTLQNNAGVSIVLDSINSEYLLPSCYLNTTPSCSGATSGEGSMEKVTYQSGEILLHGSPPPSGWHFSWNSCCRPNTVTNITSPGSQSYFLRAYMYPVFQTGSAIALSAGDTTTGVATCYDSSPYFLEGPQARTCSNEDNMLINNLGLDSDLDSLYYRFAEPLIDSSTSVPWDTGYSALSPLPSGIGATPAQIDSLTGVITFNSNMIGSWASCVEVESWRGNYMIGKVYRDLPIFTLSCATDTGLCANNAVNEAPSFEIVNDSASKPISVIQSLAGDTLFYKIYAAPGDNISFTLNALDLTPHANCQSEQLSFVGFGATLSDSSNYSSTTSCLLSGPCATLSASTANGAFTSNDSLSVDFEWTVTTAHLNPIVLGTIAPAIYPFYFKVTDDECPVNKSSSIIVIVEVDDPVSAAPNVQTSCISIDSTGYPILNWSPNPDTVNWGAYVIYAIDSSLNPLALDTINNWSTATYTDSLSAAGSVVGYIVGTTNPTFSSWNYSQPITSIINTSIMFNGIQFMATPGYSFYQWVLCDTSGYITIPSANASTYTPTQTGDYGVLIINGTCNIVSDCLSYIPFNITEFERSVYIYPNPSSVDVVSFSRGGFKARISDLSGKVVVSPQEILTDHPMLDITGLAKGTYIVVCESGDFIFRKTLIVI